MVRVQRREGRGIERLILGQRSRRRRHLPRRPPPVAEANMPVHQEGERVEGRGRGEQGVKRKEELIGAERGMVWHSEMMGETSPTPIDIVEGSFTDRATD